MELDIFKRNGYQATKSLGYAKQFLDINFSFWYETLLHCISEENVCVEDISDELFSHKKTIKIV